MESWKKIAGGAAAVLAVYIIVVPFFWGFLAPSPKVVCAQEWSHNVDMPVSLHITAWHGNYTIGKVDFFVDNLKSQMPGTEGSLAAVVLHSEPRKQEWALWNPLKRITFPQSTTLEFTVPLERLATENQVGPGTITGMFMIQIDHPGTHVPSRTVANTPRQQTNIRQIPFTITLN